MTENPEEADDKHTPPVLSIIIPAHGQADVTAVCLNSLITYPPDLPWELIVVDDASSPPLQTQLGHFAERILRLRFVRNAANRGFAASCNTGARAAQGSCLLFLNNDTEARAGWWQPLYKVLTTSPHIGIVTPKLIFPDGSIQHCGKVWKDLSVPNSQAHHLYYKMPADAPCVNHSREFTVICGACILVRADEFNAVGGFDERYANGWEDDDLCYSYASRGQRAYYVAESVLVHHQSTTLNREIVSLQASLPDQEALARLGDAMQQQTATPEQIRTAQTAQATMQQIEAKLLQIRERFQRNRALFFDKWGAEIERDDYHYYRKDGFSIDPDYQRLDPAIQKLLGKPFERDDSVSPAKQGIVSMVILTWNQLAFTKECVRSIQAHTPEPHEIIFVDNGSDDGTVPWLRELVAANRNYRLIANNENLGFARGCNQGITTATGDAILLLNNDVVVTAEWLAGLLECLESRIDSGIVGPLTNNISGLQRVQHIGYTSLDGLDAFAAGYRTQHRHRHIPCRRIVGFCMLFRRELVNQIGLLDERFGSGNFEDDDYCVRAALTGCTNLIAGDVFIHHHGSASFSGNKINYSKAISGNMHLYTEKWSQPVSDPQLARQIQLLKVREAAELCYQRFELDQAVNLLLQEGIRTYPDAAPLYLQLASYLLDAERYTDAIAVLRELPPGTADFASHWLQACCLAHLGQLAEAKNITSELQPHPADTFKVQLLHGLIARGGGDQGAARRHFNAAIAANPGDGLAYTFLGQIEHENGEPLGIDLLERGFLLSPDQQVARTAYHNAICGTAAYSRAVPVFEDVLAFFPNSKGARYFLIDICIRAEMFDRAMVQIEDALVRFGTDPAMLAAAEPVRAALGPLTLPQGKRSTASLCMIVKNEEKHLPRCLASLKPIVDEMIIVDTGSTDLTRMIATIFGAQVHDFPWNGDFSAARNTSLAHATGDWILIMDADEVIATVDHRRFNEFLPTVSGPCAFVMETRNYTDKVSLEKWRPNDGSYPEQEMGGGWFPSSKIRLFPNYRGIRFEQPIHELVDYSVKELGIPFLDLPVPIHHYGHLDKERQRSKQEQYFALGLRKLAEAGADDIKALTELAIQAAELEKYDQAIELWQQILAKVPDFPLAHFNLSYAYLQTARFIDALAAAKSALTHQASYADAAINGAIAALCLGDNETAHTLLAHVTAQDREKPHFDLTRGVLLLCSDNTAEGIAIMRQLQTRGIQIAGFLASMVRKLDQSGLTVRAQELLAALREAGISIDGQTLGASVHSPAAPRAVSD